MKNRTLWPKHLNVSTPETNKKITYTTKPTIEFNNVHNLFTRWKM